MLAVSAARIVAVHDVVADNAAAAAGIIAEAGQVRSAHGCATRNPLPCSCNAAVCPNCRQEGVDQCVGHSGSWCAAVIDSITVYH